MATIVFDEEIDPITGSIHGLTFATSQAGSYVKRRPSPIQHHTNELMKLRSILSAAGKFFAPLTNPQKRAWAIWASENGIPLPFPGGWLQQGFAGFCTVEVNANLAGDSFYITPPDELPNDGVVFSDLVLIDKDTVRATFLPAQADADDRIYLRQAVPGPGFRQWDPANGYIAQYSELEPNSTFDFTTKFSHLTGWHGRYWLGTQDEKGRRSIETLFDI